MDKKIELFNFNKVLETKEIEEIKQALNYYRNLASDINFEFPKYIMLAKTEKQNSQSHEPFYGWNDFNSKAIVVAPRAINLLPYRVEEISSLKGTIIHELGHNIESQNSISSKWKEKFGWESINDEEFKTWPKEKQEARSYGMETKFPQRCITEYAQVNPAEDICESIVGYIANAPDLDLEKKEFIRRFFDNKNKEVSISKNEKVIIPKLSNKIKYYKKEPEIKIVRKNIEEEPIE